MYGGIAPFLQSLPVRGRHLIKFHFRGFHLPNPVPSSVSSCSDVGYEWGSDVLRVKLVQNTCVLFWKLRVQSSISFSSLDFDLCKENAASSGFHSPLPQYCRIFLSANPKMQSTTSYCKLEINRELFPVRPGRCPLLKNRVPSGALPVGEMFHEVLTADLSEPLSQMTDVFGVALLNYDRTWHSVTDPKERSRLTFDP